METREKKSLAMTLIGHGVVLMAVFLSAAFVHRPKVEYMEIDLGLGGPKSPGGASVPPPPATGEEAPEQPRPKPQPRQQSEFPTQKKPPAKKPVPEKKKPVAKKTPAKSVVQKSNKLVVRNKAAKPPLKPAASESASDIRRRMEERLGKANASSSPSDASGPPGDGSGNTTGTSNRFAAYLGGLQEQLQIAWEQPTAAETGMKTEVSFLVANSGHLTGIRVAKSSGNAEMDQSALLAVKSLGSYQPWPEDFTSDLAQITVEFECKPNP